MAFNLPRSTFKFVNPAGCIPLIGGRSISTSSPSLAGHDENSSRPVPVAEVRRYAIDCMVKVGTKKPHAAALADVLVAADYRGHYSHGLNRLEMYVQDVETGICDSNAVPTIVNDKFATALVNGQNTLGPVVGNFCMNLAIEKAKAYGVGWVTANSKNIFTKPFFLFYNNTILTKQIPITME